VAAWLPIRQKQQWQRDIGLSAGDDRVAMSVVDANPSRQPTAFRLSKSLSIF